MLDCSTRWNSLLAMLSRFQQLVSCVQKSLIELKLSNEVTQADYAVVGEIVAALQPLRWLWKLFVVGTAISLL